MNPSTVVYLNGEYVPAAEAKVSVLDRGFLFGDGVYEVIPVYRGTPFRLAEHLKRLDHSLIKIRIAPPLSHDKWHTILRELIKRNGGGDQSLYLQITRGTAPRDHAFPNNIPPTIVVMSNPIIPVESQLRNDGVSVITLDDFRWPFCEIKAITLLPNVLAKQQAIDMGAHEAIFIRNGEVAEGTSSNLFIVKNRELITPPKSQYLLPGVTRDLVLELAAIHHIVAREQRLTLMDLQQADEIMPVTRLNNKPVGNGLPGPLYSRMLAQYQDYKREARIAADLERQESA